jgi:uncharacterized protein YjbI with pentapeptide repeats
LIAVGLGLLFSLLAIAFSCAIATFPGEWQEDLLAKWDKLMWAVTAHNTLFSAEPDEFTHRRFPFSNTLVLPGLNVYEGLGIDDPEKAKWRDFVFRPRGRDLRGAIFAFASLPRVDFTGANLRGARLLGAHLQGASLDWVQLQGASLDSAQLQGASLGSAQLQGASLDSAQLQGAQLFGAQLQGAWLAHAQLQGSWLEGAQLQGAWLAGAQLQGALVAGAQLQGVSFSGATLKATDLHGTYLWRSNQADTPATLSAIRMWEDDKTWHPRWQDSKQQDRAWDDKAYDALRISLQSLPSGRLRDDALGRIEILDCSSPDKTLQSCNPAAAPPPKAAEWRNAVTTDTVGVKAYRDALAESLKALFCSGNENAIFVVHAVAKFGPLRQAGPAALGLIAELLSKDSSDCPVAVSLTDADRAMLQSIKQEITSIEKPGG